MEDTSFVSLSIERYNKLYDAAKGHGWKPIELYDPAKYDWVLVQCWDGDYECIPFVAERRNNLWYDRNDNLVHFEVKYFFDMQQLS